MHKKSTINALKIFIIGAIISLLCFLACCACNQTELDYGEWHHDEKYHWRYDSNGVEVDRGIHNFVW